eukprot:m.49753 g.49753  ORF g.49753 m.49753 type:complete len:93 (+) comp15076_c0_seq2:28-306(+)
MFSLGSLLEATLLVVNALAVLQETTPSIHPGQPPKPRFLANLGWTLEKTAFGTEQTSVKAKFVQLTNAVRTILRVPLIAVNILSIAYLLLFG